MSRTAMAVLAVLVLLPAIQADDLQDKPKDAKAGKLATPAEQYRALVDEYQKSVQEYQKEAGQAKTEEEKRKVREKYLFPPNVMFAFRFFELAEKYPKKSVAPDALLWVYQNVSQGNLPVGALDRLFKDHIESKQIGQVCETLPGRTWVPADTEKQVRKAIDKNPHREVKGLACLCLAQMLQNRAENLSGDQAEKLINEAKEWYERVIREHGDVKVSRASLGEKAKGALFALDPVGKKAPEIEGQDLDGKKLKLRDFKGKVVVLVSWATWCVPCMAMVPHEREMVKRLDGKPFALLGINSDGDREKAKEVAKKKGMTWPSWWDGEDGPVGAQWNVRALPTIYVLDHKGVIRYKDVRGEALDKVVDLLLKEMDGEKK